jgi:hypothetical protein
LRLWLLAPVASHSGALLAVNIETLADAPADFG